jgi:hypothetical protein
MTKHTSDIFQNPTELKLDKLSFCPTHAKGLQEWLTGVSILQLGTSSKSLFNALLEISELKCQEMLRFDLIQILHPTLENILTSLEKHFANQGLITTDRNDQIIELAMLLRSHFAKIYIDIAKRCEQQLNQQKFSIFSFGHKKSLQTARMASIYYAIQQLTMLLYQQQMLYTTPMPGQWLATHQLIDCAIQHNFYQSNLNQILGTQHQISTIAQAYSQLILLDIFNTNQIRPAEIQGLFHINEVILSGGDPLTLSNRKLKLWIDRLETLPQIKFLRIHSRVPIVIPNRVDEELISILKNSRLRIILVVHSNHASELDDFTCSKLSQLAKEQITVLNQAVLLKGVNDTADVLVNLSYRLFDAGVMPYYLHVLDKVKGAHHFDRAPEDISQIYAEVLARLPGYLVPKLVREIAGEKNKTPLFGVSTF